MPMFKNPSAQGELTFVKVSDNVSSFVPPKNATLSKAENGSLVVGHSETGHHHVMDPDCAVMYDLPNTLTSLLVVNEQTDITHLRDFDTHKPITFEPGVYKVHRGREFKSEKWRAVQD